METNTQDPTSLCEDLAATLLHASQLIAQLAPFTKTLSLLSPTDISFLGTDRYPITTCEKNIHDAIDQSPTKIEACRKLLQADTCGYIHIRQYPDAVKAKLINPYAAHKFIFTDDDLCKARNRQRRG